MNIIDLIDKKRLNKKLSKEEIQFIVDGYLDGQIKDYQMSSLLMAIVINGMSFKETLDLTDVYINSGEILDLSGINETVVDKHSTGGVGDKTTLVLAPLVASCGVKVAKMSGRSLGHTGGTADKLESINGYNVNLSSDSFIKQVNDIKVAITTQTGNLVPADKKIYALRDVSGTVFSIPLIAASIMSKKIASGASMIVIDVKVGNGGLITNLTNAKELSDLMIKIGKHYQRKVVCVLSNMNQPLGKTIGNSLEVIESINLLKGKGNKDLYNLVVTLGSIMVSLGKNIDITEAKELIITNINNNMGYKKLVEMVNYQGGNLDDLKLASNSYVVSSLKSGYINQIDTKKLGELTKYLGAGRITKDDVIDHGVGFVLNKKLGDYVKEDEEILKVYYNQKNIDKNEILACFTIEEKLKKLEPLIYEIIK